MFFKNLFTKKEQNSNETPQKIVLTPEDNYTELEDINDYESNIALADFHFNKGEYEKAELRYFKAGVRKKGDSYAYEMEEKCKQKLWEEAVNKFGENFAKAIWNREVIVGMTKEMVAICLGNVIESKDNICYYKSRNKDYKRVKIEFDQHDKVMSTKELKS